jgi:type II secretory pathway pseudopilin PulG
MSTSPVVCSASSSKKYSFALAEVCVALIVISIAISYIFSSLHQTIARYTTLRQEITCHQIADEQLGRYIAVFFTTPPDFDSAVSGLEAHSIHDGFEVHTTARVSETTEADNDSCKEEKKKTCLLTLTITVHPSGNDPISRSRSTNLCIVKEGL